MLSELHKQIKPHFTPSLQKDLKTAVNTLTKALNYSDSAQCPADQYNRPLPDLYRILEAHLRDGGKSPHTVRNIKNNISRLFRYAEEKHLLTIKPAIPKRNAVPISLTRPDSAGMRVRNDGSSLVFRLWPENLIKEWEGFHAWATALVVDGRNAQFRKREATMILHRTLLEGFFGYLVHQRHMETLCFDQLFDINLLRDYVRWHVNEKHHRVTRTIESFITRCISLSNQYRPTPKLTEQLRELKRTLPAPTRVYDKRNVWVSLADLDRVGRGLWPDKRPEDLDLRNQAPGSIIASRAGLSIVFRLWTYIPYRQRNIREMKLGENLYKDSDGNWHIKFVGEQLKVATKKGKTNVFDLPFPPDLVPDLETYLNVWRPILAKMTNHQYPHVFLKKSGYTWDTKFNHNESTNFNVLIRRTTYAYLGRFTTPHMVRTIWATEWIKNTHGDFYTVAYMLNDRLETVIASYAELLDEDVAEKAYRTIHERINGHGN